MIFSKTSDAELISGIRNGNDKTLNYIYGRVLPKVESFVLSKSGSYQDAMDVFQESIYTLYIRIKNEEIKPEKSLVSYLFTMCKNRWYAELNKRKEINLTIDDFVEKLSDKQDETINEFKELSKLDLYMEHFNRLDKQCRELIEMSMANYSYKEIIEELNISNEGYARKRKFVCIEKLIKLIEKDKRFKKILIENE